jgi:predicted acyltransferase
MVSEIGEKLLEPVRGSIYRNYYASWLNPANASLFFALSFVALNFVVAYAMYRRKWFVKV